MRCLNNFTASTVDTKLLNTPTKQTGCELCGCKNMLSYNMIKKSIMRLITVTPKFAPVE